MSKVLFVLTSHTQLGSTGRVTGFYFDEMAAPYWALIDAGHEVEIASIAGGKAPVDPTSLAEDPAERPAPVVRFLADAEAMAKLENTKAIDEVDASGFDAVFLPGGHGTMYDFPTSKPLAEIVSTVFNAGGVVGAVCHGPAGLVGATRPDGRPIVEGRRVNGFRDAEEVAVELTDQMPFPLETKLRALGGLFEGGDNFTPYAVRDGNLVTGQNPMSAGPVAEKLVEALAETKALAAAD